VRLPAGRALRLEYDARYDRTVPVLAQTQFVLLRRGRETVLTYTTLPAARPFYRANFERSARSFRFLRAGS
jgi:hypothetical protein